jgi:hypothetical protein
VRSGSGPAEGGRLVARATLQPCPVNRSVTLRMEEFVTYSLEESPSS